MLVLKHLISWNNRTTDSMDFYLPLLCLLQREGSDSGGRDREGHCIFLLDGILTWCCQLKCNFFFLLQQISTVEYRNRLYRLPVQQTHIESWVFRSRKQSTASVIFGRVRRGLFLKDPISKKFHLSIRKNEKVIWLPTVICPSIPQVSGARTIFLLLLIESEPWIVNIKRV